MPSDLKLLKQHQSATDPQVTSLQKPPLSRGGFFLEKCLNLYKIVALIEKFDPRG